MNGSIIAMGGAVRPEGTALKVFFERSGGASSWIAILPTASEYPESGQETAMALARMGLHRPAQILPVWSRADAENPIFLQALREASGIFLGGGSQVRLMAAIRGTTMHQVLLDANRRGAVIAGTSAGTAVLSRVMIAYGSSGALPSGEIATFSEGLGLVENIIFDQHFRQRNRLGRLIFAVASHPGMLGIGMDEDTAAIIEDDCLAVTGSSTVTVVDGSGMVASNAAEVSGGQPVAVSGLSLHILAPGHRFDLTRHSQIK